MSSSLSTIDQRFKGRRRSSWFSALMEVIRDGTMMQEVIKEYRTTDQRGIKHK
ncbi:MAG: hypothetical protein WCF23_13900 [Candidatus Nitrosopolaris sp.]